ncbi:tetratricopeptide repeat protein, partial [Actinocrispum sp. NPDC049592]|uniref:tetratricopeptide repeat protein n=1 Tax=Actinocrispum sp. NPDC049592 TaxID=3154835 RepID=UPI0034481A9F
MEWERVFAVAGPGGAGSGYVVAPRLVLTSGHVVAAKGASVTLFRPGKPDVFTGSVVWFGSEDAALVRIDGDTWTPMDGAVAWGRSVTHLPGIQCLSWGRADLAQRPGRAIDVAQPSGTLNPGDRIVGDRYVMHLNTPPPVPTKNVPSPWGGLSGAALFCGDLLIGVIAMDLAGGQHAALEAVPVYVLLRDPEFRGLLGSYAGPLVGIEVRQLADPHARAPLARVIASPAGLLPARRAVVPFRGRDELLARLDTWSSTPGVGVWILHGPGGQGKTRLAHQFGDQLTEQGWEVVWLAADIPTEQVKVLAHTVVPLLVVIDYAESRTQQVTGVLNSLAARRTGTPVKIVMLARTAGAWLDELASQNDAISDLLTRHVHHGARVEPLPVLDATTVGQQDAYRSSVAAFAAALPRVSGMDHMSWPAVAASLPDRTWPAGAQPTVLAVQMSAVADLLDAASSDTQTSQVPDGEQKGPEDRLLEHESRYWRTTAKAFGVMPGLTMATLTDAVAAAILLGPPSSADADQLLSRVPGLSDRSLQTRDAVRQWLARLYPSSDKDIAFDSLQPDRLAERLIGRLILDDTRVCLVEVLAATVTPAEAGRLLTVCVRVAAHTVLGEQVGQAVSRWCVRFAHTLAVAAIEVATQAEVPAPLIRALNEIAGDNAIDTDLLIELASALPQQTHALAEIAVAITESLVTQHRRASERTPDNPSPALAASLNNLAVRLGDLGRHEEGLAAITEAVNIRRRLAAERPDAFLPDLARSLNNLSVRLGALGRREEGLAASTEAVNIRRRLAAERPDAFLPNLAMSLNNLSVQLGALGRREDGLAASTEAVEAYRQLAAERPDAFLPELATSLNNLSVRLSDLGRREEGLAASTEAVNIRRRLAAERPDAFLPDLATSLNNLSVRLSALGRHEEGLAASTEAVNIRRRLAAERPDAFLPDLATSLNNLSNRLSALGRHEEGLAASTEAVEAYRQLAAERPDAFLPDLAGSLNNLAVRLGDLGRHEEGLAAITEAVNIRRRLAAERPDAFLPDLAMSLNNLSADLGDLGRREDGLAISTEAVEAYRQLAAKRPDAFLPNLAGSLNNLSGQLGALDRREEGLAAITEAVEAYRRLAAERPDAFL